MTDAIANDGSVSAAGTKSGNALSRSPTVFSGATTANGTRSGWSGRRRHTYTVAPSETRGATVHRTPPTRSACWSRSSYAATAPSTTNRTVLIAPATTIVPTATSRGRHARLRASTVAAVVSITSVWHSAASPTSGGRGDRVPGRPSAAISRRRRSRRPSTCDDRRRPSGCAAHTSTGDRPRRRGPPPRRARPRPARA